MFDRIGQVRASAVVDLYEAEAKVDAPHDPSCISLIEEDPVTVGRSSPKVLRSHLIDSTGHIGQEARCVKVDRLFHHLIVGTRPNRHPLELREQHRNRSLAPDGSLGPGELSANCVRSNARCGADGRLRSD